MLAFDYNGTAAIVAAVFAGIAWVIGALNHRTTTTISRQIDTGPGARTLGNIAADLAAPPVTPADDPETPAP
jgi:hypothetical protein